MKLLLKFICMSVWFNKKILIRSFNLSTTLKKSYFRALKRFLTYRLFIYEIILKGRDPVFDINKMDNLTPYLCIHDFLLT